MSNVRNLRAAAAVAALLTALSAGPGRAEELDGPAVLARVQGWLDGTRTLEGRFSQSLISGAFGSGMEDSGRLYIERPGRMRWDYAEPEPKVALVDGRKTWLYLEEDRVLQLGSLDEQDDLLPMLLAGEGRLSELFQPSLVEGEPFRLRLVPASGSDALEEIVLTVRPPHFAIEVAEVLDGAGNRMLYRFSKLRRNRGLPEGVFEFVPPPGTEISGAH